jgi:hypothetical protein
MNNLTLKVNGVLIIPSSHFLERFGERFISNKSEGLKALIEESYVVSFQEGGRIRLFHPVSHIAISLRRQSKGSFIALTSFYVKEKETVRMYKAFPYKLSFRDWVNA